MFRVFGSAILFCFVTMALAQRPAHTLGDYAGNWQSSFNGQPFLTLKLHDDKGRLTGTVSNGDIETNASGEITSATAKPGESDILTTRVLANGNLELTCRAPDSQDVTTIVISLLDKSTASLRFQLPPGAAVSIKPLQLKKVQP
jgi:hypothetical protein